MKIIKRSGKETGFDGSKIIDAVTKANQEVAEGDRLSQIQIEAIADRISEVCENMDKKLKITENDILIYNIL